MGLHRGKKCSFNQLCVTIFQQGLGRAEQPPVPLQDFLPFLFNIDYFHTDYFSPCIYGLTTLYKEPYNLTTIFQSEVFQTEKDNQNNS
jgi:hypothetical protein